MVEILRPLDVLVVVAALLVIFPGEASGGCSTVTTFNAGLAPRVDKYWDRRDLIADALAAEGADVLCLQEMWFEDDMRHVINDLKSMYPHHYSPLHTGKNKLKDDSWSWFARSACKASELSAMIFYLLPCAISKGCAKVFSESSEAGLGCVASKCSKTLKDNSIGPNCVSCLVISSSGVLDITDRCHKVFGSDLRMNPSGLMVMSKKPLSNSIYKPYFEGRDMTLHRGFIQTEVEGVGTMMCSHLTSVFDHYWEYDLPFSSYAEQSLAEIDVIHQRLGTSNHILAADLNTGKAVSSSDPAKNLTAEAPESIARLTSYGYNTDKYLTDDGRCTYCISNDLVKSHNVAIDDVLVMGNAFSSVTKQRVLDQKNPSLSDHYGVRARLCS
ncbi:hypothetical protein PoB_006403000 [Plakobranchus ocellatus]|uniref:Endonuclease/exonuclease/phosphatase domain-containing protein n=1 Tax=Plakobranchus ocellatus TaxID=259542 RepID=A0AAV4D077_9GAST|nr:hypothetical protein PoB_006403000 [Plakobranchus ocellatus]